MNLSRYEKAEFASRLKSYRRADKKYRQVALRRCTAMSCRAVMLSDLYLARAQAAQRLAELIDKVLRTKV